QFCQPNAGRRGRRGRSRNDGRGQLPRSGAEPSGFNCTFWPAKIASNDSCVVDEPAVTTIPYVPGCGSCKLMLIATGIFTDAVLGTSGAGWPVSTWPFISGTIGTPASSAITTFSGYLAPTSLVVKPSPTAIAS